MQREYKPPTNNKTKTTTTRILSIALTLAMVTGSINLTALPAQAAAKKPGKTAIVSVTSDNNGKVTVTVKKAKKAAGYQVVLATDKKFKKNVVTTTTKTLTATTTNAKQGTTYYVRARAYLVKKKKTKWGKWSAVTTHKVRVHQHRWGKWTVTKAATCTTKGSKTRVCTDNKSHKQTLPIPATGHNWAAWKTTKAATCTTAGTRIRTCKNNKKHTQTHAVKATGHNWDEWKVTKEATCTEPGERTRTCKNDKSHVQTQEIKAAGHNWDEWKVTKETTCTESGEMARVCKNDAEHVETKEIDKNDNHDWSEWIVTKVATCEEKGERTRTCKNDAGHIETQEIDPIGHNWDEWIVTQAATCGKPGIKTRTCKNNAEHVETEEIDPTGQHKWGEWKVTKEATCKDAGEETRVCDNCEHTETREIKKTDNHTWGEWLVTKEATPEENGIETRTCTTCKETENRELVYIECSHDSWSEWESYQPATCTEKAKEIHTCNACGRKETRDVGEPNGHNMKHIPAADPTCVLPGNTEYWFCKTCELYFADSNGKTEITQEDTCIPATGHTLNKVDAVEETCETDGHEEYWTCGTCGLYFASPDTQTPSAQAEFTIPADHKWNIVKEEAATCTTPQKTTYTCERCGETKTECGDAPLGHDYHEEYQYSKHNSFEVTGLDPSSYDLNGMNEKQYFIRTECERCGDTCYRNNYCEIESKESCLSQDHTWAKAFYSAGNFGFYTYSDNEISYMSLDNFESLLKSRFPNATRSITGRIWDASGNQLDLENVKIIAYVKSEERLSDIEQDNYPEISNYYDFLVNINPILINKYPNRKDEFDLNNFFTEEKKDGYYLYKIFYSDVFKDFSDSYKEIKRIPITDDMTRFQKVKAIADYINYFFLYDNEKYSEGQQSHSLDTVKENNEFGYGYMLYFNRKKGVCSELAYLFHFIASYYGIHSIYMGSGNGNHMWNVIDIDGKYFWFDLTNTVGHNGLKTQDRNLLYFGWSLSGTNSFYQSLDSRYGSTYEEKKENLTKTLKFDDDYLNRTDYFSLPIYASDSKEDRAWSEDDYIPDWNTVSFAKHNCCYEIDRVSTSIKDLNNDILFTKGVYISQFVVSCCNHTEESILYGTVRCCQDQVNRISYNLCIPIGRYAEKHKNWTSLTDDGIYNIVPVIKRYKKEGDYIIDDFRFFASYENEVKEISLSSDDVEFIVKENNKLDHQVIEVVFQGRYAVFNDYDESESGIHWRTIEINGFK